MKDESEQDDRGADRPGNRPEGAVNGALPEARGDAGGGDDPEVVPLPGDGTLEASLEGAADASRIDGLPEGWSPDVGLISERAGSGPLDLIAEADEALRDAAGEVDESGISHASRVLIGTGKSGIVAASDVITGNGSHGSGGSAVAGAPPVEESAPGDAAVDPTPSGGETGPTGIEEWGDLVASVDDVPSESVGFGALLTQDPADQGVASDSFTGDSQGIVEGVAEAIELGMPAIAARRASPARKGGLGQLVGVVLGGVLAIPVTLAILMWGFQRDPLGLGASVPEGMRWLLPSTVRRRSEPRVPAVAGGGPSLDAIASEATASLQATASPVADPSPDVTPPPHPDAVVVDPRMESGTDDAGTDTGVGLAADTVDASPAAPAPGGGDETPITIDAPEVARPTVAPEAPLLPDLAPLDAAVERALVATENLGRIDPSGDPQQREQSLVSWYRGIADAADALALAERAFADVGIDPSEPRRRYDALAVRLASERGAEIADLGTMWLTAVRRPTEGAVLVGVLEEERGAGPWRWGRVAIGGGDPRRVSFFARTLVGVKPGDEVMVTGVLGDPATMWASDVRQLPGGRGKPAEAVESPPPDAGPAAGADGT